MTHKFEVGDKAIVIGLPPEYYDPRALSVDRRGEIVTIIFPLTQLYNCVSGRLAEVYIVDSISTNGKIIGYEPHDLKPYYDGDEKSEWDETVFKPKELISV